MPGLVFHQRIGGLPCISGAENRLPNREAVPPKQLTTTRPLLRSCPVAACRKLSPSHGLRRAQAISNRRWKAALGLQDVRLFTRPLRTANATALPGSCVGYGCQKLRQFM